jgi:hypothetical protein
VLGDDDLLSHFVESGGVRPVEIKTHSVGVAEFVKVNEASVSLGG